MLHLELKIRTIRTVLVKSITYKLEIDLKLYLSPCVCKDRGWDTHRKS